MTPRPILALVLSAAATACAVTDAPPLVIPGAPRNAETVRLDDLGGARRGDVAFRSWTGSFERQYVVVGTERWNEQRFDGSFRLDGLGGDAVGICAMREGTLKREGPLVGVVYDLPVIDYAYDCELEAGDATGRLQIGEVVGSTYQPWGDRSGVVYLGDGPVLEIRSLHQLEGTSLRFGQPMGYALFENGDAVAVVNLQGSRPVLSLPPAGADTALTAELAALALALLVTD